MAQLTIYLDEQTHRKVKAAAKREKMPVSQWAKNKLTRTFNDDWPADYFSLLGSIREGDLERPEANWGSDLSRENL